MNVWTDYDKTNDILFVKFRDCKNARAIQHADFLMERFDTDTGELVAIELHGLMTIIQRTKEMGHGGLLIYTRDRLRGCDICGEVPADREILEVRVQTTKAVAKEGQFSRLAGWSTTNWVCVKCVEALPDSWKKLFGRPSLDDYVRIRKIKEDEDTETWEVRKKSRPENK